MKKEGNILIADEGKLIMHENHNCASKKIALGKEADPNQWIEIPEKDWDFENNIYIGEM